MVNSQKWAASTYKLVLSETTRMKYKELDMMQHNTKPKSDPIAEYKSVFQDTSLFRDMKSMVSSFQMNG